MNAKIVFIVGLVASLLSTTSRAADAGSFGTPDAERENRLQRMYEKYNSEPVDDDKWQSMLGARSSEAYKIQTGDTLWDLSETMFGDGYYWPKLWAENRGIENPHQIEPHRQVRFIAGNEASAPTVRIESSYEAPKPYYIEDTKERLTAEEIAGGSIVEDSQTIGQRPEIPKETRRSAPVLRNFPPSFKVPASVKHTGEFDENGLDIGEVKALKVPASVTLNSFMSSEYPRKLGFVKEIEVQEATASILQNVFLELGRKVKVGDRLNVVVPKENITDDDGKELGHVVEVNGSVEVTEVINEENGVYKAIVVDCVMPIQLNASITDEPLPKASFSATGPRKNVQGKIIGGEYASDRKIFGTASVIYLNIGSDSGVQEGDLLAVHSVRKSRRPDTELEDIGRPIGIIKIAKVSKAASTALIVNTIDEIRPGDLTGGEFPSFKSYRIGSRTDTVSVDQIDNDDSNQSYKEEFDHEDGSPVTPSAPGNDIDITD